MYSFEPNEEQQMLMDAVGKYAGNDLRPAAHEAEESRELPKKLISKGWELGLLQASIPASVNAPRSRVRWLLKKWPSAISQALSQ
jgi:alkylation response protein AidB-like acyl-CoA dehydrogenase